MRFDSIDTIPKSESGDYVTLNDKKYKIVDRKRIQKNSIAENHTTSKETEFEIIVESVDDEVSDTND